MPKIKDLIERQEGQPPQRGPRGRVFEDRPPSLEELRGKVPEKGEAKDLQYLGERTFGIAGLLGVSLTDAEKLVKDNMERAAQRESELRVVQAIKDARTLTQDMEQRTRKAPPDKRLAFEKQEEKFGPFALTGPIRELTETMRQVKNSSLAPEEINTAYKKLSDDYVAERADRVHQLVQREVDVAHFAEDKAKQIGQFGGKTWRRWERGTGLVAGGGYHLIDTLTRAVTLGKYGDTAAEYARMYHQVLAEPDMQAVVDNWFDRYMGGAIESGPFMAAALAPAMLTGGAVIPSYAAGFLVAYGVEGNSAYQQSLDRGEPEWKARTRGVVVGMVNGGIEIYGGGPAKFYKDRIIRNTMGKLAKLKQFSRHTIKTALREGIVEEVPQEISMMILGGDVPRKTDGTIDGNTIVTRLWDAAAIGTIAGGMADVTVTATQAAAGAATQKPSTPKAPKAPEVGPSVTPTPAAQLSGLSWLEIQQEARNYGVNAFQKRDILTKELIEKMGQAEMPPAERFGEMSWHELQAEARKRGINAFQKRADVIDQLLEKGKEVLTDKGIEAREEALIEGEEGRKLREDLGIEPTKLGRAGLEQEAAILEERLTNLFEGLSEEEHAELELELASIEAKIETVMREESEELKELEEAEEEISREEREATESEVSRPVEDVGPPKKPPKAPPEAVPAPEEPSPEQLSRLAPADPAIIDTANAALSAQLAGVERIRKQEVEPAKKALRRQQIAKAMGIGEAVAAEGASAADVIRRSKGGYKVEMAIAEITPLELTEEQWDAYSRQVYNTYPGPEFQFQQTTAQDALDALREGRMLTDSQLALLIPIMGIETVEDILTLVKKMGDKEQRHWNLARDLVLFWKAPFNYDVQFVRNAINFLPTNPIKYTVGTYKALRSHASQTYADNLIEAVNKDVNHQDAVDAGMPFLEAGELAKLTLLPEQYRGRLPSRLVKVGKKRSPPVWLTTMPIRGMGRAQLAAERGFVASANWFMQQLWNSKVDGWNRALTVLETVELTEEERRRIEDKKVKHQENFVEVVSTYMKILRAKSSTGRAIQTAANYVLWSPSMTWSRFRRPKLLLTASGNRAYAMALEAATIGKIYLVTMMLTSIANFFRDDDDQIKVEYDPRATDWGKFQLGDTKFDLGGGEMQHYRTLAQFVTQSIKTQSGRIVEVPRLDIAKSYAEGRETALIGVMHELLTGETIFGQKVWAAPDLEALEAEGTVTAEAYIEVWKRVENIPGGKAMFLTGEYLMEHLMPAALHSFAEAAITDGWPQAVAAGVTEALALGVQSYKKRASAELSLLQDDLAEAVYKKKWEKLTEGEQAFIRRTEPVLREKGVEVRQERQRFTDKPFERREIRKTESRLFQALTVPVQKELGKLGLTAGAVSRRFGPVTAPFYLSDVRFEEYEKLTQRHVQKALDRLFGKATYKKADLAQKEDKIRAALSEAKREAREQLRTRIDKGELK